MRSGRASCVGRDVRRNSPPQSQIIIGGAKKGQQMAQRLNVQYTNFGNAFNCKLCEYPLLMFGCDNSTCDNYYVKRLQEKDAPQNTKEICHTAPNRVLCKSFNAGEL
jgi:hypothetical protein